MFVIKRTDQGGGYVSMPGSDKSYTHKLENARTFSTEKQADDERCKGNEIVVPVSELLNKP